MGAVRNLRAAPYTCWSCRRVRRRAAGLQRPV